MRVRMLALLIAVCTALGLTAAPAPAITGGTPDGDRHPAGALLIYYQDGARQSCSAALVSPTVLLTAGHCAADAVGSTLVSFDSVVAEEPPIPYAPAVDPSVGYTPEELAAAGLISGTSHAHPAYSDDNDEDAWYDAGVIVLDEPVTGIDPMPIAGVGTLDGVQQRDLRHTLFTAVGYGAEMRKPESGPQKKRPALFPLMRRYVEVPGQKITDQLLRTNANRKGGSEAGGTCFGDSGGPVLLDGEIVAVVSYGKKYCQNLASHQRVEIPGVRGWLAGFGV